MFSLYSLCRWKYFHTILFSIFTIWKFCNTGTWSPSSPTYQYLTHDFYATLAGYPRPQQSCPKGRQMASRWRRHQGIIRHWAISPSFHINRTCQLWSVPCQLCNWKRYYSKCFTFRWTGISWQRVTATTPHNHAPDRWTWVTLKLSSCFCVNILLIWIWLPPSLDTTLTEIPICFWTMTSLRCTLAGEMLL